LVHRLHSKVVLARLRLRFRTRHLMANKFLTFLDEGSFWLLEHLTSVPHCVADCGEVTAPHLFSLGVAFQFHQSTLSTRLSHLNRFLNVAGRLCSLAW